MAKKILIKNDFNFDIVGVISKFKDYKTAWLFNEITNLNFTKIKENKSFPLFSFFSANFANTDIYLIENKNDNGIIVNDLSQFDFFLITNNFKNFEKIINSKNFQKNHIIISGILDKSKFKKKTIDLLSSLI